MMTAATTEPALMSILFFVVRSAPIGMRTAVSAYRQSIHIGWRVSVQTDLNEQAMGNVEVCRKIAEVFRLILR